MALSTISGPHTKVAPYLRAKRRVGTVGYPMTLGYRTQKVLYLQAPDLTIGARKTPFLKSSLVRWSIFARLWARREGEDERWRRDMVRSHISKGCLLCNSLMMM